MFAFLNGRGGVLVLALAALGMPALAQTVTESGDAGNLVDEGLAQDATGAVSQIDGTLTGSSDEDCYTISLDDPDHTDIEVVSFSPGNDSQLFLFDGTTGLYFDDDDGAGLLSRMIGADFLSVGIMGGTYNLCLSAWDSDPFNPDSVALFPTPGLPNPASGLPLLSYWRDGLSTDTIAYSITITVNAIPDNPLAESGDAGDVVTGAAQDALGLAIDQITGSIADSLDADCYALSITNAGNFEAEVISFAPDGDSQLFLFSTAGQALVHDDDGNDLLSIINGNDLIAAGVGEGDYTLCVSPFDFDPFNADSSGLFPGGATFPSPAVGDSVLAYWGQESSLSFSASTYDLRLTGVDGVNAPTEPELEATATSSLTVAPGDTVTFDITVTNNTGEPATGDIYWDVAQDPRQHGLIFHGSLADGESGSLSYAQTIPLTAPPGSYTYNVKIGVYPVMTADVVSFPLVITGSAPREHSEIERAFGAVGQTGEKDASYRRALAAAARAPYETWASSLTSPWVVSARPRPAGARAVTPAVAVYPNPFNPTTQFTFEVADDAAVALAVYDLLGREVARLVDAPLEAGLHTLSFDARGLATGIYLYRLTVGQDIQTGRITLLK